MRDLFISLGSRRQYHLSTSVLGGRLVAMNAFHVDAVASSAEISTTVTVYGDVHAVLVALEIV